MPEGQGHTKSYVWSTDDFLGRGATADVYIGRNKKTGIKVAVKVFNLKANRRPIEVQDREFDILKKLDHENIVRLIAIEPEIKRSESCPVLIMEYCESGSLHTFLDEPQNAHGLPETEFLMCMEHITSGMRHLRQQNIVHRDVKPGNILRAIGDDGRSIYKLTDFGGAKELPEGENFMSLIGTEEYLHPALFERAIIRPSTPHPVEFPAEVDLWSMGVTLYHAATGSLPFRPFAGRRDPHNMHHMTSKKESGVISGVMKSATGPIEWSKRLPDTCNLSRYLKSELPPVLAGLVECDISKMSTFDEFFQQVDDITLRIPVHVFSVRDMELLTLYVTEDNKIGDLQALISRYTGVLPVKQYLYFEGVRLEDIIDSKAYARDWPRTSQQTPFIMVSEKAKKNLKLEKPSYLKAPTAPVTSRGNVDIYQQLDYTGDIVIMVQDACNLIDQHELAIHHMHTTIKMLCSDITHELEHVATVKDLAEQVEGDLKKLKDDVICLLKKCKEPGQEQTVKNIETLTDKALEHCKNFRKEASALQGCSIKSWSGQTLITSLEKQRLVAKMRRRQEEAEDFYNDTKNQLQSKAYLMSSKVTSNQYARIRLGNIADEAIKALEDFLANEASQCLREANITLDSVVPKMVKLKESNPEATCVSLIQEHIRVSGDVREFLSATLKNPSTMLRLSGTAGTLSYMTGSGVSSQASEQKSRVSLPHDGSGDRQHEEQMGIIASNLKKLREKNDELLKPMKQNMEMVQKIKDLIEKNYSLPAETEDGWTICD